ncbi:MAG: hypothetical protein NC177_13875 [Ruminococcus flavefaciens]|nr:hypothetical protein [Ruminococcus flavefaciens]
MKLNYRDKVILGVLLAIVIAIAGFVGLIKPKNEEIKEDEATLAQKQEEQADLEARIAKIGPLKTNIDETYEETTKLIADFISLDDISNTDGSAEISNPRKLEQYMQHYAEECGVRIDNLEVSALREATLNYYYPEVEAAPASSMRSMADLNGDYAIEDVERNAESIALSLRNPESVIQSQYGVRVTGTKEALWNYLKAIEELNKTMIVNQVSIDDYSFGADSEDESASQPVNPETPENPEEQPAENAEQPAEEGAETPEPAPAPEALTIDDADTSEIQIVISLYSVYDMPKPNTEE